MACKLFKDVSYYEKLLSSVLGDSNGKLFDMVYDLSSTGEKSEFDELIMGMGYMMDWKNEIPENGENK